MRTPSRRSRGSLERDVLACLAVTATPMTPAEVQAELGGGLAYTTVLTALTRLHDKHALTREQRGRAYAYGLAAGAVGADGALAGVTAHRMHRLLDAGDDRAGVLARFVAELGPEDEQVLAELLGLGPGAQPVGDDQGAPA